MCCIPTCWFNNTDDAFNHGLKRNPLHPCSELAAFASARAPGAARNCMEVEEPPFSELRLEDLLCPGASAASSHFCARLRRDSFARVSLPADASALLLRAQAE